MICNFFEDVNKVKIPPEIDLSHFWCGAIRVRENFKQKTESWRIPETEIDPFLFRLTLQSSMLIRGKLIFKSVPNNKSLKDTLKINLTNQNYPILNSLNNLICKNMTWPQNNSSSILTDSKSVSLKMSPLLVIIIEISFNLT